MNARALAAVAVLASCAASPERCPHADVSTFLSRPAHDLYVERHGDGPLLIAVHGEAHHGIFHPVLDQLSDEYTVVLYDRVDYGRTRVDAARSEPFAAAVEVEDLDAVRASTGSARCSLVAYSGGGPVALEYARQFPQRVDKLVLVGTFADDEARVVLAQDLVREVLDDADRAALLARIDQQPPAGAVAERLARFAVLPHVFHSAPIAEDTVRGWIEQGCLDAATHPLAPLRANLYSGYDGMELLPGIDVPTLVISGRHDCITPLAHVRSVAAALPRARLLVIEQAGHLVFAEQPAQFVAAVRTFLSE